MGVLNQDPSMNGLFKDLRVRVNSLEQSKRFTAPFVTAHPTNPSQGDVWVRSDLGKVYAYINSAVTELTTGGVSGVSSAGGGTGISVSPSTGAITITNTGVTAFSSSSGLSTNTSATGAVSVTNTGVTSNVAGTGISVSGATGAVTISNAGVTSLTTSSGLSTNTSATGAVSVTNTGVTSLVAGTNITLSGSTGAVTVNATGGGASSQTTSNLMTYTMMSMEF